MQPNSIDEYIATQAEELSEAHRALLSTFHKYEKIDTTKLGKSQF